MVHSFHCKKNNLILFFIVKNTLKSCELLLVKKYLSAQVAWSCYRMSLLHASGPVLHLHGLGSFGLSLSRWSMRTVDVGILCAIPQWRNRGNWRVTLITYAINVLVGKFASDYRLVLLNCGKFWSAFWLKCLPFFFITTVIVCLRETLRGENINFLNSYLLVIFHMCPNANLMHA